MQEGAHGDEQTEAWPVGQWLLVVHHVGARCAGSPRSASALPRTAGQRPRQCRRTAQPGRWELRESVLCPLGRRCLLWWSKNAISGLTWHLCQVEPDMALLDHQSGHRLPKGLHRDFRRLEGEVSQTQLLHQPRVGTTLVHLFQCLGLVDLQDSHGMQDRGGLACSTVSFGCELKGFGRETRTIPPSDI